MEFLGECEAQCSCVKGSICTRQALDAPDRHSVYEANDLASFASSGFRRFAFCVSAGVVVSTSRQRPCVVGRDETCLYGSDWLAGTEDAGTAQCASLAGHPWYGSEYFDKALVMIRVTEDAKCAQSTSLAHSSE